jgi:hypothetical protein
MNHSLCWGKITMNGFFSRHLDLPLLPKAMALVRTRERPNKNHEYTEVRSEATDYTTVATACTGLTLDGGLSSPLSDQSNGSLTHGAT